MISSKHPIIAHGELYAKTITKKGGGGTPEIPHTYEVAKQRITADIDRIFQAIQEKQEVFLTEKIMCVRMEPKFEAKSYVPTQLSADDGINIVGGRKYSFTDDAEIKQDAKLYFLKTDDKGIRTIKETLTSGAKDNVETWRNQIGSIHSLDLLKPEEKIMGFPEEWETGTVEIVLHPIENEHAQMLDLFYSTSKIPKKDTRVKTYKDGLTFISAKCSRVELDNIKRFNPLRAIHPLGKIDLSPVRMVSGESAPQLLSSNKKSSIVVGVFDGGTDETNSLLNGHVKETDCVPTTPDERFLKHGTAVCGAVLHGNLVGKSKFGMLPMPCVSVASYRVFPVQDTEDLELYEIIDVIEQVVSSRPDISLYNLSFGPSGAIIDDSINRFTYVLDRLTYELHENARNPLFCVAVGNDGYLIEPLNRIQSPADMVNGLGVGAYSYQAGSKIRAPYSCVGCGREGAKVKPDLLDFGGSDEYPFVLVGLQPNSLVMGKGTSYAAPCAVNKIGTLMAKSENIVPHLGRTLLIHNAIFDEKISRKEQGYGFCPDEVDDVLFCDDKKVSVMYSGTLKPSQVINLPIFAPNINRVKGMVNISWTITTIVAPYANDPDAYTNDCILDVFIPHDGKFKFSKRNPETQELIDEKTLNLCKAADVVEAEGLLADGYKKSEIPVSCSAKYFWSEADLRSVDLKWDTVIKKRRSMRGSSLRNPVLTLQAIDRNDFNAPYIKYHVVISIEAVNYPGSLYDTVLQEYKNLVPIELRDINRIMVDV